MPDTSIVLSLVDKFSSTVRSIASANSGFSKSAEEAQRKAQQYAKQLAAVRDQQAKLQTDLRAAKNDLKAAEKAFDECADAANAEALEEAHRKYGSLKDDLSDLQRSAKDAQKAMRDLNDEGSRGGGKGGGNGSLATRLGQSGLASAVGDWASNIAGIYVQSAFGDAAGNYFSSALSTAGTGAAIGTAILPGIGTAIGAVVGAGAGLVTAAFEEKAKKDDYFRDSAKQAYAEAEEWQAGVKERGIQTAATREMDEIAFNTLLGEGVGSQYLSDLRVMAARTPMEYSDLTSISKALATGFKDDPQRMLQLMNSVGNAGAAVGLDASGMQSVATAMSRMQSSGKTTLEYINLMQERGVDAVGMLAEGLEVSKGTIYEMISKGQIEGSRAVDIIQEKMDGMFDGAMEKQSKTFSGLSSTLEDSYTELDAAFGNAYNEERGKGIQREIDYLNGDYSSAALSDAYAAMGKWEAEVENLQGDMRNAALKTVTEGITSALFDEEARSRLQALNKEYEADAAAGGKNAGRILAEAKAIAQAEYTQTEEYKLRLESEMALVKGMQAAMAESYWQFGYECADQWSKGYESVFKERYGFDPELEEIPDPGGVYYGDYDYGALNAYGLDRVPYDGYRAVLHEGERVLTASQARMADRGGTGSMVVDIHDCSFAVRDEGDVDLIAAAIVEKIVSAQGVYAG